MSSRLKYLLIASLLLNFLLLGICIGRLSSNLVPRPPHPASGPEHPRILSLLEQSNQEQKRELNEQIHAARSHIHQLLKQDAVDRNQFQQAVEQLKTHYDRKLQLQSAELYELTRELPREQRQQLFNALEHQPFSGAHPPRPPAPNPPERRPAE